MQKHAKIINHYELGPKLGEGGTGVVYEGRDLNLNRRVALKFPSPQHLGSERNVQRFLREAHAISSLNHPNIATIYAVEEHEGARFLVLEYLAGGTLKTRLRELREAGKKCSLREVFEYSAQIAQGLAHSHRHGIIHRDVKSDNVMFTAEGRVKVTDFSLAKHQTAEHLTQQGGIAGTIAYMSPEQAQGLEIDRRTDVFSFGVLLYEVTTGEKPFKGEHEAIVLDQIINHPTPPVRLSRPDCPEALEAVILRATAKNPDDRYQTMDVLAVDLRKAMEREAPSGTDWDDSMFSTVRKEPESLCAEVRGGGVGLLGGRGARAGSRSRRVAALCILVGVLVGGVFMAWPPELPGIVDRPKSPGPMDIAILPFEILDQNPTNELFSAGLVEGLIAKLTQAERFQKGLRIVPMSEIRREKIANPRDARKRFGVKQALRGSVVRRGDQVQVSVELIETKDVRQIGGRVITTELTNVSVLQDGIFQKVADLLGLKFELEARETLGEGQTQSREAYEAYSSGLGKLKRFDKDSDLDLACLYFQAALRADPGYALASAALGEAYWRKYERTKEEVWIEQARKNCQRALELNKKLSPVYVTLGLLDLGTGKGEDAISRFNQALDLHPANPDALRGLAQAYEGLGFMKEAEDTFKRAIELRRNNWADFNALGTFYYRTGRYEEAVDQFRHVVRVTPENYVGYRNLGGGLAMLGKYDDAKTNTLRSLSLQPTAQAYSNLGSILFFQGNYRDAEKMFEEAVKSPSPDQRVWGNLADAYRVGKEDARKTLEAYEKAITYTLNDLAVNARDGEARANLAVYYAGIGDREKSLEAIESASGLAPMNVNVLFKSVLVFEMAGDRVKALGALEEALRHRYPMAEIEHHPDLENLRRDQRFAELVSLGAVKKNNQSKEAR